MASKKNEQLRALNTEDMQQELEATEHQYQQLYFKHTVMGLDNARDLTEMRRDIARIKTHLRERELTEMSSEELAKRSKIRARRRVRRKK